MPFCSSVRAAVVLLLASAPLTLSVASGEATQPVADLELVVTATRSAQDPRWLPVYASTVSGGDLARAPLAQTPGLLRGSAGLMVQKTNHGGGSPFMRGLTGKQVLLLVDGVRLNNSLYRSGPHQYLNTVDTYTLREIEIVRGPGSVLYGTDALGGVINLRTREAGSDARAQGVHAAPGMAVGGSSADQSVRGRVQVDTQIGDGGLRLGASARHFGDVRGGGDVEIQPHTGYHEGSADAAARYGLMPGVELVGATFFLRQFDVPKTSEMTLDGKLKYNYEPQTRSLSYLQLRGHSLDVAAIDSFAMGLSYQYHGEGEEVQIDADSPETHERNDARTLGSLAHVTWHLPMGNELSLGGELYHDWLDTSKVAVADGRIETRSPAFPDGARYLSGGIYLQDAWRPIDQLRVLAGGRFSQFSASGELRDGDGTLHVLELDTHDLTGSFGLVVNPVAPVYLIGHVARGFRAPNMEDFFGKVDFANEIPNVGLKPEYSLEYQGGARLIVAGLQAQAYYFRDNISNLIDRVTVGERRDAFDTVAVVQRQNIGEARIQGAEAELAYSWRGLRARGTYGFSYGQELRADGTTAPLRRMPPHQGLASLGYFWDSGTFVMPELLWAAAQTRLSAGDISDKRIGSEGTPGYTVVNVRGGYRFESGLALTGGIENLADRQYKSHGSGVYAPGLNGYLEARFGL